MKKVIFMIYASLISSIVLVSSAALATPAVGGFIYMAPLKIARLNNIQSNSITIIEGDLPHFCSLMMRTSIYGLSLTQSFTGLFKFTRAFSPKEEVQFSVDKDAQLIFPLPQRDMYSDGITISTRDGKSIASNIAAAFPLPMGGVVGILAGMC